MLTQDQLTKLEPLTQHPKFGQLLKDAIETWKIATPCQNDHGLSEDDYSLRDKINPFCCLLGAAFAKNPPKNPHLSFTEALFDVYGLECHASHFTEGFDGYDDYSSPESNFTSEVRKIIFGS